MKKHFNIYTLILSLLFAAFAITGCANLFDENETSLTVTVTFNANDGSESPKTYTQEGPVGKEFQLTPNTFKRTGYEFIGWNKDSTATSSSYKDGGTVSFSESTTLYAIWSSSECTITFNGNGGKTAGGAETSTQVVERNKAVKLTPEIFTRENYAILGWAADSKATEVEYKTGDLYLTSESVTLYAVWGKLDQHYSLTFENMTAPGGTYWKDPSSVPTDFYANVDTVLPTIEDISSDTMNLTNKYFVGWCTDSGLAASSMITTLPKGAYPRDMVLYAKFKELGSYVAFDGSDTQNVGDGSLASPYASINRALLDLNSSDYDDLNWKITVIGQITEDHIQIATGQMHAKKLDIEGFVGEYKNNAYTAADDKLTCSSGSVVSVVGIAGDPSKELTFKNITITGGNNTENGGGITITATTATVILDSGSVISGNTATKKGGGIYIDGGTVTLSGGTIKGNTATSCGGGVYVASGTFTLSSGDIGVDGAANTAIYGGGIYNAGTLEVNGGSISYNNATGTNEYGHSKGVGAGIYNKGTLTLSGSYSITSNTANRLAGGIYIVKESSTPTLYPVPSAISNNSPTDVDGGVDVDESAN